MSIWVLFDLDGTLVDNSEGITKSTQFALDSYGYQMCIRDRMRFA